MKDGITENLEDALSELLDQSLGHSGHLRPLDKLLLDIAGKKSIVLHIKPLVRNGGASHIGNFDTTIVAQKSILGEDSLNRILNI